MQDKTSRRLTISGENGKIGTLTLGGVDILLECNTPALEKEMRELIRKIKAGRVVVESAAKTAPEQTGLDKLHKEMIERIVDALKQMFGDLAVTQANLVDGLVVSYEGRVIKLERDSAETVEALVSRYEHIMGPVALRISRKAVQPLLENETETAMLKRFFEPKGSPEGGGT